MSSPVGDALGIYISIPFCRSKCTYCNFASGVYPAGQHAPYVARLIEDIGDAGQWAARMGVDLPRRVDTVYLGGGTPSLLAPALLQRLFAAVRNEFDLEPGAEITVECAPGQIPDETLDSLVRVGVNRISLGVQSFVDREAQVSGRLHNRATVEADLRRLRQAGIVNLSVDLIAGLAGQTPASWDDSLSVLIDSGVPHASVYMFEVDEDSRLGREMLTRGARYCAGLVPTDDTIAKMYERAIERLAEAGLNQYEISNFCRPGFASRHNLRYWQRRPYLGLGLDASSMLRCELHAADDVGAGYKLGAPSSRLFSGERAGSHQSQPESALERENSKERVLRITTTDDLAAYLAASQAAETAWQSPARQHEEAWFLGLRLNTGVDIAALQREFGPETVAPALAAVARLAEDGLLVSDGKTVRLTAEGQLLSNDVFQEFLDLDLEPVAARR